jgi:hypothetical protein
MDVDRPLCDHAQTKAIVAVEVFGHPGGMVELEQIAQQQRADDRRRVRGPGWIEWRRPIDPSAGGLLLR